MRKEIERRPLVLVAAGLISGLVIPTHWPVVILLLVGVALLGGWPHRATVLVACLLGLALSPTPAHTIQGREYVDGSSTVISVPKPYPDRQTCIVEIGARRMLLSLEPNAPLAMGDTVRVQGIAKPLSEIAEPIYAPRGVCAKLVPIRWFVTRPASWPQRVSDRARRSFIAFTGRVLPDQVAASIDALCFNADSLLDDTTEEALRQTGTIHIVSASGLQVLILSHTLLLLLSLAPIPRWAQVTLIGTLLVLYAMATGLHGPIVRAVVACFLTLSAYLVRREPDMISALAAAAVVYLLWHPYEVYQPGFQLSFVTTGAFALFLPRLSQARTAPQVVWREFRPSLVASLATAPLIAYHFGYVSPVGLLANSLAVFVVPLVMVLSLGGFAASFLWPAVGAGLLAAAVPLVGWLHASVVWCSSLSFASIPVPAFPAYWLVALYGALLLTWRRRVVQA